MKNELRELALVRCGPCGHDASRRPDSDATTAQAPTTTVHDRERRIIRIDVDSGGTSTVEGARIGDSEGRIGDPYAGRYESKPGKYAKGHTITVMPRAAADSVYRIVLETDGARVKSYRAGRMPGVAHVEGCG